MNMTTYYIYTNQYIGQMIVGIDVNSTKHWIPMDPLNTDYANYLAWVAAGNTAAPYTG